MRDSSVVITLRRDESNGMNSVLRGIAMPCYTRPILTLVLQLALCLASPALAQYTRDPLPSWHEGPAKQAILDFVARSTKEGGPDFVPYDERIAVFDQDGTLWVEHPMYTQVLYCLSRVPAVVKGRPELKDKEPFKTVLSGDKEAMDKLALKD